MAIYEFLKDGIKQVKATQFSAEGFRERQDLQRLLREQIEIVAPDTMVIAEEFGNWEESSRRIDLLGLDKQANLVVLELKRTESGGHLELQAIRYAAMVSTMTFDQVVEAHARFLSDQNQEQDPRKAILDFLGWEEPQEEQFAQDIRIVLVSADFSKEITSTVMWLNDRTLDIRCIRLKPYKLDDRLLVDAQQIVPLPEAEDYQIQIREKGQRKRISRQQKWDEHRFFDTLGENVTAELLTLAKDLLQFATDLTGQHTNWGKGQVGSYNVGATLVGTRYSLFSVYTDGTFSVNLGWNYSKFTEHDDQLTERYRNEISLRLSLDFEQTSWEKGWPKADLEILEKDDGAAFKQLIDSFISEVDTLLSTH